MATTLPNTGAIIPEMNEAPDQAVNNAAFTAIDAKIGAHLAESASKHISDSGGNANGYYVKFDDGVMICYNIATDIEGLSVAPNTAHSIGNKLFPATFIHFPTVSLNGYVTDANGEPHGITLSSFAVYTSAENVHFFNNSPSTITRIVGFSWLAVGRWKY